MKKRFNLYYLFLEDKERNALVKEKIEEIRRILDDFYSKMRKKCPALPESKNNELGKE